MATTCGAMVKRPWVSTISLMGLMFILSCQLFRMNRPPNQPTVPSGRSTGTPLISYEFSSKATDADSDLLSLRFSWGDGDTSNWSGLISEGQAGEATHAFPLADTYLIRAQARDSSGALSVWSEPHVIAIHGPNRAPATPPVPTGPDIGYNGISYTFRATTTDPDGDPIAVRFTWDDGDTSDWSGLVPSGETLSMTHAYAATDSYFIRAQARDVDSAVSDWSTAHAILVSATLTSPGLQIRHYGWWDAPYPYGDIWGVTFWGYVVDTARTTADSVVIHAKISDADTMAWLIAGTLTPGDSARFYFSQMGHWHFPQMELLWATCKPVSEANGARPELP